MRIEMKISEKHKPTVTKGTRRNSSDFTNAVLGLEVGEAITLEWSEDMRSAITDFNRNTQSRVGQLGKINGRSFKAVRVADGVSEVQRLS
jgi:hypothetical protein